MSEIEQILGNDPLLQLQDDCTAMLLGNPFTADVPFTSFRRQVTEHMADEARAAWSIRTEGKTGIACLVLMPSCVREYQNVPGLQLEAEIVIRTFEDPKVNNTGLSAERVALANLKWLDGLIIEDLMALYGDDKGPALKPNYDFDGMLVYDSTLRGKLPQETLDRTAPVDITDDDAGTVTLSCDDVDAVIYYTDSGAGPEPGKAEQVYGGPFEVVSGSIVRAISWNPAKRPSGIVKGKITIL